MVHTFPISPISGYSVRGRYDMDAAVIFLEKPVNWNTNPNIWPICLPPGGKIENFIGKPAMVTGWGLTGKGRAASVLEKGPVLAIFMKTFFDQYAKNLGHTGVKIQPRTWISCVSEKLVLTCCYITYNPEKSPAAI
jgi:hypothetical protein